MGAIVTISAIGVAHRGHWARSSRVCCGSRGMRGPWNEALILTTTSVRVGSTAAFATAWRPWNDSFHGIEERRGDLGTLAKNLISRFFESGRSIGPAPAASGNAIGACRIACTIARPRERLDYPGRGPQAVFAHGRAIRLQNPASANLLHSLTTARHFRSCRSKGASTSRAREPDCGENRALTANPLP